MIHILKFHEIYYNITDYNIKNSVYYKLYIIYYI